MGTKVTSRAFSIRPLKESKASAWATAGKPQSNRMPQSVVICHAYQLGRLKALLSTAMVSSLEASSAACIASWVRRLSISC